MNKKQAKEVAINIIDRFLGESKLENIETFVRFVSLNDLSYKKIAQELQSLIDEINKVKKVLESGGKR